jgi:hypothetical protein
VLIGDSIIKWKFHQQLYIFGISVLINYRTPFFLVSWEGWEVLSQMLISTETLEHNVLPFPHLPLQWLSCLQEITNICKNSMLFE